MKKIEHAYLDHIIFQNLKLFLEKLFKKWNWSNIASLKKEQNIYSYFIFAMFPIASVNNFGSK